MSDIVSAMVGYDTQHDTIETWQNLLMFGGWLEDPHDMGFNGDNNAKYINCVISVA